MANIHRKQATDIIGKGENAPVKEREKVDYIFKDIIRAYPEDYSRIVQTREEWAAQFD